MNEADRQRGCFYGLAIGDALGAAVEFQRPGSFPPVTDYRDGGPHGLAAGEWTDDTSMGLALADSIIEAGWDLDDQMRRYVRWWREGDYSVNGRCFDIGNTVASALSRFETEGDASRSGDRSERASGNGSLMRLAPVAIWQYRQPLVVERLVHFAGESSRPTHASPQCVSACQYMALILCGLMAGEPQQRVLDYDWEPMRQLRELAPLHPAVDAVARGSFRDTGPPHIQGSGYAIKSLEAALWAFHDAESFRDAVLRAVNLGYDADTTGAVCGQLAGAHWGLSGIPEAWVSGLARGEMIDVALRGLLASEGDRSA